MSFILNTDLIPTMVTQPKRTETPLKNSGHARFIEKPLRASKSSSGLKLEIKVSQEFHSTGIPLLVSPHILRFRNLGQIDVARMKKCQNGWEIEIAEIKSSSIGTEMINRGQKKRLILAGQFLSGLFGHSVKLIHLIGKK
jgi:hypothetical protein